MAKNKHIMLYKITSYPKPPYEQGTHTVTSAEYGYILATESYQAKWRARDQWGIPHEHEVEARLIRRCPASAREILAKCRKMNQQAEVLEKWLKSCG